MQKSAAASKYRGTRLLALDQSSVKTGYALFCGSDLTRWGLLNTKKRKRRGQKVLLHVQPDSFYDYKDQTGFCCV